MNNTLVFEEDLLFPLPSRPNYLYAAPWRSNSNKLGTPSDFTVAFGIPDPDRVADPTFRDLTAGDYALAPSSPARAMYAGSRE